MQNNQPTCGQRRSLAGIRASNAQAARAFRAVFALLCVFIHPMPRAELIEDLSLMSPKAVGLANAVTADPPGVDSIHFNPAGLADIEQTSYEVKLATFAMSNRYRTGEQRVGDRIQEVYESLAGEAYPTDPLANQQGEINHAAALSPGGKFDEMEVPFALAGGGAIRLGDTGLVVATAAYSPMLVGFTRDESDLGRYDGKEVAFTRLTYFSPSVGYRIDEHWAVGASIGFSYQGISLTTDLRSPQVIAAFIPVVGRELTGQSFSLGPYDDIATLSTTMEDSFSMNINLGVLWSPTPWLTFGASYRSETRSDLEGEFEMRYSEKFVEMSGSLVGLVPNISGESVERGSAQMEFATPRHLSLGASIKLTPAWKLNIDLQQSFYSKWDNFKVELGQDVDFLVIGSYVDSDARARSMTLQRNYRDALSWSIGTEYQLNDRYRVRMGYQQRASVIPSNALDLALPMGEAEFYGMGVEYNLPDNTRFQASVGYLTSSYDIDYDQSDNVNSEDPLNLVYNPYVFLSLESSVQTKLFALSYRKPF